MYLGTYCQNALRYHSRPRQGTRSTDPLCMMDTDRYRYRHIFLHWRRVSSTPLWNVNLYRKLCFEKCGHSGYLSKFFSYVLGTLLWDNFFNHFTLKGSNESLRVWQWGPPHPFMHTQVPPSHRPPLSHTPPQYAAKNYSSIEPIQGRPELMDYGKNLHEQCKR